MTVTTEAAAIAYLDGLADVAWTRAWVVGRDLDREREDAASERGLARALLDKMAICADARAPR